MENFISFIHVIVSILLVVTILMQSASSGLSAMLGGTGTVKMEKRGAEKLVFQVCIVLFVLFLVLSLLRWFI
jgi:protein translocase SecG subunit